MLAPKLKVLSLGDVKDAASLLLQGEDAVLGIDTGIRQLRDLLFKIGEPRVRTALAKSKP